LFARKSRGIINLISGISTAVVACITAAMIVVISAFNGFDDLVKEIFSNFDAPLTIVPVEGKYIPDSLIVIDQFKAIEGIIAVSKVIEEDARFSHDNLDAIGTVKGVEVDYADYTNLDSMVYDGVFLLQSDSSSFAVVGSGIRAELNMPIREYAPTLLNINAPVRGRSLARQKEEAISYESIQVSGVFAINAELDAKYIVVPIDFARAVFGLEDAVSSIELFVSDEENIDDLKLAVERQLPPGLKVKTRYEKNELIYKTNASEKWATFLILLFIFLIACFNIIASLTMLIIEKKRDIFTMSTMGMDSADVKRIFVYEGILINLLGAGVGLFMGWLICFIQLKFGVISMSGAAVDYYPISMKWSDFLGIFITVTTVGGLFSTTLVRLLIHRFAGNAMMNSRALS
jgi:lipoprotein-releasing system permease protein